MPQNAILFAVFKGPSGVPVVSTANKQGTLVTASRPGSTYYVDETNGSASNSGGPFTPFATLAAANALAVAGDTIYITGTVYVSATVVFAQDNIRVIGLNATSQNNRARIIQTGSAVFTPLVSVTGSGSSFENLATFHGFNDASAQICWTDSGGRNHYNNVDFLGMGHATAAAHAGSRSLLISGSTGEHQFDNCRIGLDTVTRATGTNASLELTGGSPRNVFNNPIFRAYCTNAADVHIKIGSGGIDRDLTLNNPVFLASTDSGATPLTAAISAHASSGGSVIVNGGMSVGADKISAAGPVYVNGAVPTAATSSLGVVAA